MRLIDADLMIDDLSQEIVEHVLNGMKGTPAYTSDLKSMIDRLEDEDQAPTVDAVSVVRCSECKYNNACFTQSFVESEGVLPFDRDTWYCADGKRKGGDE